MSNDALSESRSQKSPLLRHLLAYSAAVAAVAAAYVLRHALSLLVGPGLPPFIVFYPAVMTIALLSGKGPGLLASAIAALMTVLWIFPAQGHPASSATADTLGVALFFTMGVFMSVVADLYRRARQRAAAYQQELTLNSELERRVKERTAELQAANGELEAFAYAVSHDLRAPLRALSGFSHALLEDHGATLKGEARQYLDQITLSSSRMGELIDGILRLSRSTRGELRREEVDLSSLAERILDAFMKSEPDRRVAWTIEPELTARCDAKLTELVLTNLLGNSWKYTERTPMPTIHFSGEILDGEKSFCVRDNGAGFDMKYAARLFQPFQRLHRQDEFPGIGIGLATVQRIIHRHGGTIRATAAPGEGAAFNFSLSLPGSSHKETP